MDEDQLHKGKHFLFFFREAFSYWLVSSTESYTLPYVK